MTTAQQLALVASEFDACGIPSGDLRDRLIFLRGLCSALGLRTRRTPSVPLPLGEGLAGLEGESPAVPPASAPSGLSTVEPLSAELDEPTAEEPRAEVATGGTQDHRIPAAVGEFVCRFDGEAPDEGEWLELRLPTESVGGAA